MTEATWQELSGLAAAVLAAVGIFVFIRMIVHRRLAAAAALARAEGEIARAALEERLRGREQELERARAELDAAREREEGLRESVARLRAREAELATRIEEEREQSAEKLALLEVAERKLADAFQALASDALARNNRAFLDLAEQKLAGARTEAEGQLEARRTAIDALVAPLREQLERYETGLRELERVRQEAYGQLTQQLGSLASSQDGLVRETGKLVTALRRPEVRGNWGEVQLQRAVEFAGMVDRVDFRTQETVQGEEGRLRPDLVVQLPGGKRVVVDAKVPLDAYLSAIEATTDEERRVALARHARQVRTHLGRLAEKRYWDQFDDAPEFVVLFLPGEAYFSAALEQDPTLIEDAFQQSVLIATPATLVALLKTVSYGWRQESLAANAREISDAARELYDRLRKFAEHLGGVGKGLSSAVGAYNRAVGSFELRVLPQGRRFESLGPADGQTLETPVALENGPRALSADAEPAEAED